MKDKEQPQPGDVTLDPQADTPAAGRVYDLDSNDPDPIDPTGPGEDDPNAGEGARRPSLKVSRKDILDRFTAKNQAITSLAKEKPALDKERSALAEEKAALEGQLREMRDKWLRTAAEFENYRKRSAKEWELLKQQSKSEVILEVLASLDDFERAFAVVEPGDESEFVRGIRLIYNNLLQVLQKMGVVEIDALHAPFDPVRHMAIGQTEVAGAESGQVTQVVQKGYALNGSVIRPARVFVAK